MCGIAGEIAFTRAADVCAVQRMADTMARRGPDGHGAWASGGVALAHRRLKIIDLSERAAQPMVDSDLGLTIVFNGCIYNYRALRDELEAEGFRFFSTSDSEVIAKAYRCWGVRCVERFAGMFAFAIAERDSGRVVLARDRLGIKPLYLSEQEGALRFASTLPALLAGGDVDTRLDPVALHHYFSWHAVVPAPHTILRGVRKLPPATVMTIEPDGTRTQTTYWDPPYERRPEHDGMSERDWSDAVLEALRVAVQRRMVADVPVGVLLSGGLDSSLIVALLAEAGQRDLQTFSIGFEHGPEVEGDEFRWSDMVAQRYGTDHKRWRVSGDEVLGALDDAILAMSEPMTSHDAIAFYLLSQEVSGAGCKVVQSGQGADEVFAGYSWYPPLLGAPGLGDDAYAAEFIDRDPAEMADLLHPRRLPPVDVSRRFVGEHFARAGADDPLDRALRLDTQIMLVDDPVKRVDNMTMAWGLEARTPFLDHELVELAAACPPELKLAHGGKGVLKTAARTLLSETVIDRPKGYFPVPAISHLEGEPLERVRAALTSHAARDRGLYKPAHVEALLADPVGARTGIGSSKLWQVGLLELWLQGHGI
ncbi:N-acetylglutaminylglutamine amidotransferase [Conexibacter sp. CPCC 206217]|uniref:N-acetylglutaminylglutamine amidotransferase n=1 Tax=Conexibacter sp. CPCC 206217 TaxID=3064574 RepID=UPI002728ED00|nr:N-acetylglutaminylglutamine amidotransferase [Conexibacter sp. CPCC 206217]MDO8213341.1 N-acetylglutaminylglutamine amidotransferase [Conexibacter sp. CPCC 206217]